MAKADDHERAAQSEEARREIDRLFRDLLKIQWPMAPDPAPDMGLINIANKRRLRPKKANDRR